MGGVAPLVCGRLVVPPRTLYVRYGKRVFDCIAAVLLMVVLAPAYIGTVFVVLSSGWPVVFRQRRVGRSGRVFWMLKFRSMREVDESPRGMDAFRPRMSRLIPGGRYIRRTKLDELPQLLNVLWGDMSLVGPRPYPEEKYRMVAKETAGFKVRVAVRPGATGLAKLRLGEKEYHGAWRREVMYDRWYVRHISLRVDVWILLATAIMLLRRLYGSE